MSGGVDSSVAAALLKEQGFDVVGAHMKCYNLDGCGEKDAEDARRVAEQLGIPFYVFDFEQAYKDRVVKYMVSGYKKGITPNPDVMCNREIKFGLFLEKSLSLGADYVATGHYVRIAFSVQRSAYSGKKGQTLNHKRYTLYAAADKNKDQSYFLWTLTQKQLKHCLFPLGDYLKPKVRQLAQKFGLLTAAKKDSQGICFLGQISLVEFLKKYLSEKKGNVLDASGNIIGTHAGAHLYTIGQRHGFRVQSEKPLYVVAKDISNNTLVVSEKDRNLDIAVREITLQEVNLINPIMNYSASILVRTRYRQPLVCAFLTFGGNLVLEKSQKYIAPGQSAVFYLPTGEMLGGGVIA